ncbi:rab-GTPase-TBC domain-containing protein [Gamsiella multidivaricata]|uniref:rab-GTPase-TBC domain-containing protein n=1 Tax=Gamsiella multidivaricata TaxID=101098 RepID=UPI00221E4FEE|nr:rab-GTPase-TBC domain-containing protein [Gamsiella multidivaricata]KAI7815950.1 rab-GTPase-TBC domain-containing protein [Gamsiella multidivaricata]
MTTTTSSGPETTETTETHQPTRPFMDRKASSPHLKASSPPASAFFTLSSGTSAGSPFTLPPSPHETDSAAPTSWTDTANINDGHLENERNQRHRISTSVAPTILGVPQLDIRPLKESVEPQPTSVSDRAVAEGSIGQKDPVSYVCNETHDTPAVSAAAEMDVDTPRRKPHRLQHRQRTEDSDNEDQDNVTSAATTPTTSLILDHNSILNVDGDMSMTSPVRHTKSPPTSTSSSTSTGRRRIAESSMILSVGTRPAATAAEGGTLSPAWSMSSIPRDISAAYNSSYRDQAESPVASPMDEKLYSLVDRYGFLVEEGRTPQADKSSAKSSTPSSSRKSVRVVNGIKHQAKMIEKEQERSLKWARMAKQYTSEAKETEYSFANHPKFIKRVYKGIPDCWRAAAWSYLITKRSVGFEPNIRQIYHDMLEISSPEEEQIDLDIPRTMHGHIMFRTRYGPGQCALFKVLKAYSNFNHRVGYCQGMASVVATMLTFFNEEKTFVLLAQLFDRYQINNLVIPGFPALFEAFFIQEELTKIYAPKVFESLEIMGIATPSYASRWYITLYSAGVVPYRTLLRIWDTLFLEGFDWLYFMALALLKYHELELVQNNFERTMEMLNAKMDIQDDERLLKIARKLSKQARQTGIVAKLKARYIANQRRTMISAESAPTAS